jgi:hypothetical protein
MAVVQDVGTTSSQDKPASRTRTLYEILEVSPTASAEVIRAAYTALSEAAPSGPLVARALAARIAELDEAYRVLGNPFRRARYDEKLAQGLGNDAEASEAEPVKRSCWRCQTPIDPLGRYCSTCHWLVCETCRGCGCQNPDWLQQRPTRPVRWPAMVQARRPDRQAADPARGHRHRAL